MKNQFSDHQTLLDHGKPVEFGDSADLIGVPCFIGKNGLFPRLGDIQLVFDTLGIKNPTKFVEDCYGYPPLDLGQGNCFCTKEGDYEASTRLLLELFKLIKSKGSTLKNIWVLGSW